MKNAQRSVFVFVLLPVLAFYASCADSPMAPSHPEQGTSAARRAGVADAVSVDSADSTPSAADPLLLSGAVPQQASCTVELVKTEVFDKDKGKKGDWVAYDGTVLEIVPPEVLSFKYELKVNIPAAHSVAFRIDTILLRPGTKVTIPRPARWKPATLIGELAGNKSVELDFGIPKDVRVGNDNVDVQGNTFEITPGWVCLKGFDEVTSGTLGTFKFKGVATKKR